VLCPHFLSDLFLYLRKEDEIKKSKAEIEDCSKDNHRLKSYSLKLEVQVKELENSNRILRMKVVRSGTLCFVNYDSCYLLFFLGYLFSDESH
jgi:hypothetical protein